VRVRRVFCLRVQLLGGGLRELLDAAARGTLGTVAELGQNVGALGLVERIRDRLRVLGGRTEKVGRAGEA
jgi:hypothetical protein